MISAGNTVYMIMTRRVMMEKRICLSTPVERKIIQVVTKKDGTKVYLLKNDSFTEDWINKYVFSTHEDALAAIHKLQPTFSKVSAWNPNYDIQMLSRMLGGVK